MAFRVCVCAFVFGFSVQGRIFPKRMSPKFGSKHQLRIKNHCHQISETGRIRFRRARFQTPNAVSFLALTELQGENSVSSSWPTVCVCARQKRTHPVLRRTHRFATDPSEFSLPQQYSRNSIPAVASNSSHIPKGRAQNSFTARLWDLGRLRGRS